jgi:hypothetical protein
VTKPIPIKRFSVKPITRVHLLIPVQFQGGPLEGSSKSLKATEDRQVPPSYTPPESNDPRASHGPGIYRNRPGTTTMVWVAR